MTDDFYDQSLKRHRRIVMVAGLAGASGLVAFRLLIELGLGTGGAIHMFGVPIEYAFLGWFLALCALWSDGQRVIGTARLRSTAYEWWLGTVGLAGMMWLAQKLGFYRVMVSEAWAYRLAIASVIAVFLSASSVRRDRNIALARNAVPDVIRLLGRPMTWICALLAIGIVAMAPRSSSTPSGGAAFRRWYLRQTVSPVPPSWQVRPVTLVELIDYQCPVCRQAANRYQTVIHDAETKYGDSFRFLRVDFPLESECNPSGLVGKALGPHPAACEAAAAVRLANSMGAEKEGQVIEWLWAHQSELTPDLIFDGITQQFGMDVRGHYGALLPAIARDAAEGRRLNVFGTPTFILNGRRLPFLHAETMGTAIGIEVERKAKQTQEAER